MEPHSGQPRDVRDIEYELGQLQARLDVEQNRNTDLENELHRLHGVMAKAMKHMGMLQTALGSDILAPKITNNMLSARDRMHNRQFNHLKVHNGDVLQELQAQLVNVEPAEGTSLPDSDTGAVGHSQESVLMLQELEPAELAVAVDSALTAIASSAVKVDPHAPEGTGSITATRSFSSLLKGRLRACSPLHTDARYEPSILQHVFSFLGEDGLGRCACVCTAWRAVPLVADFPLWRNVAKEGAIPPSLRGSLWESVLLSTSHRLPQEGDLHWDVNVLLELAAISEAMDMNSIGPGRGRAPLRGRTLLKLYSLQCPTGVDASSARTTSAPSAEDIALQGAPLSLQSRTGHMYSCNERRMRLTRVPEPRTLSLDPATDGTPHTAGAQMSSRIYGKYLAAGKANERACIAARAAKDAAAAVRVARAHLHHATATVNAHAERGEPLPADMTVEFATMHEESQRTEAAFTKAEAEARSALANAASVAQSADIALVTAFLDARRQHALAVARAWTAASAKAKERNGSLMVLTDPVTGKVVPTAGLRLPAPNCLDMDGSADFGGSRSPILSRTLPTNINDMINRALDRGMLTPTITPDINPLFPLPPRLVKLLYSTSIADVDVSEEQRLGLLDIPVPPPPAEPQGLMGATLHGTPAASAMCLRLQDGDDEGVGEDGSRRMVELPAPPFSSQHQLIDADVRRTFGDIDGALRAAEDMVRQVDSSKSVIMQPETLLPTSMVACPPTPEGVAGLTREVLEGLRKRLRNALLAYAAFDRGTGYCQGQNFLTGMLLRHMSEPSAFWGLAALCHAPCYALTDAFSHGLYKTGVSFAQLNALLAVHRPRLASHLSKQGVTCDMYATSWVMTLWAGCWDILPITHVAAVWDCFLLYGSKIQTRVALSLIDAVGPVLEEGDLSTIVQLLHTIPKDKLPPTPVGLLRRAFRFKVTNRMLARMTLRYDQLTNPQRWRPARKVSLISAAGELDAGAGGGDDLYGLAGQEYPGEHCPPPSGETDSSGQDSMFSPPGTAPGHSGYAALGKSTSTVAGALGSLGFPTASVAAAFNQMAGRVRSMTVIEPHQQVSLPAAAQPAPAPSDAAAPPQLRARTYSSNNITGHRSRGNSSLDGDIGQRGLTSAAVIRRSNTIEAANVALAGRQEGAAAEATPPCSAEPADGQPLSPAAQVLTSSLSAFVQGDVISSTGVSAASSAVEHTALPSTGSPKLQAGGPATLSGRMLSTKSWFGGSSSPELSAQPSTATSPGLSSTAAPAATWATFASPSGVEAAFTVTGQAALGSPPQQTRGSDTNLSFSTPVPASPPVPPATNNRMGSADLSSPGFGEFMHATPAHSAPTVRSASLRDLSVSQGPAWNINVGGKGGGDAGEAAEDAVQDEGQPKPEGIAGGIAERFSRMLTKASNLAAGSAGGNL